MDLKKLYIGIDSGGTNCRVGLGDGSGRIIHAANYDSLHYSQAGAEAFSERILEILNDFCGGINLELNTLAGICAGAAGARQESDKKTLKGIITRKIGYPKLVIESDTAVAHYSAFDDGDGLLLISGTGSILFGKFRGKSVRIGGWGKLLGDEGSSYSISLGMLKRIAAYFDESDKISPLEIKLKTEHGLTRENLIGEIYHRNFNIHTLTPFVMRMAEEGDRICVETLDCEIDGLMRLFRTFARRHGRGDAAEVAFSGSVIENDNYFLKELKRKIAGEFGGLFRIREEKINTLKGALKIAVKNFSDEN